MVVDISDVNIARWFDGLLNRKVGNQMNKSRHLRKPFKITVEGKSVQAAVIHDAIVDLEGPRSLKLAFTRQLLHTWRWISTSQFSRTADFNGRIHATSAGFPL
ncbi:hypothetical protein H257_14334 [Aphanomyces astaci]|uniref:Uncharacterized protein n=1 Tax=Aphanomyces astaci TaxID=112090 RepID=W4FTL6_APHAT|nr:hypothetical protein H257_14334 [Aphanomyces astaci]ETV70169.1 hypothetical protein H257_14334 [Aphanomyces astaci]|eukprot:XP_009840400.1 hypothetical protein H257_14334 [Aphanomyces astaci]